MRFPSHTSTAKEIVHAANHIRRGLANERQLSLGDHLIDVDGWGYAEGNAIVFLEDPEQRWHGNHSFYDAFHPRVSIRDSGGIQRRVAVLCFINWMTDAQGNDLADGQREEFHYLLYRKSARGIYPTPIDPGGTNLGPPVAPP